MEAEIYGKDKDYIEKISDLCRFHDSQNPEHIYDITNAVIQSAQYMAAVRIRAELPPVTSLLPVLATAPRLMVYGLCSTALSVAGQVLKGIEQVFEMKKEKQRASIGIAAGRSRALGNRTETQKKELPGMAYQPSGIRLTSSQIPLSGRAMEAIKELKRQDMNSYLYLLMEDMLFATAEGLCREQGDMAEIVAGYLAEFYKRELNVKNDVNSAIVKT